MKNLAVFASGSGTNAENLALEFKNHPEVRIALILANNKNAFVLERAKKLSIPALVFNHSQFHDDTVLGILKEFNIDFIILAGFLWLIPDNILKEYPQSIVNIHPALLPKYGGKGMYGDKVHQEVLKNNDVESGITIHLVNEQYDEGEILFQARCPVHRDDDPSSLAKRIHTLEYNHYPKVVADYILNRHSVNE